MKLHVLGIDLGKTVFHIVGLDSNGKVVIRKRCSCRQLLNFTANLEVQLIGMESYSGSHFLGRALREQGHQVRFVPAQYVKRYVQKPGLIATIETDCHGRLKLTAVGRGPSRTSVWRVGSGPAPGPDGR